MVTTTRPAQATYLERPMSDTERTLLATILRHAAGTGFADLSVRQLMDASGVSKPAMLRGLDRLEGRGYLRRVRGPGGVHVRTRYYPLADRRVLAA